MSSPRSTATAAGAAFIGALAFALYCLTMPRSITFEDAGLFHGVCATGGIAHPPGYPLLTLLCTPLYQLPVDPVLLGNGLSAAFGALTCSVLVLVLRQLGTGVGAAVFGGGLFAVSRAFWSQSIIVEVYTLHSFLFMLVLLMAIRFWQRPDKTHALAVVFLFSLGFSNHWPLMALSFPGLALICLSRHEWVLTHIRRPGFLIATSGVVVLALSPYLSLVLKQSPVISYNGTIEGIDEFISYLRRETYAAQDNDEASDIIDKTRYGMWVLTEMTRQVSWPAVIAALTLPLLASIPAAIRAGLVLVFLGNSFALVALLGFDFEYANTSVFAPYPLVAWSCLAISAALFLDRLHARSRKSRLPRLGAAVAVIAAATVLADTFTRNVAWNNRADAWLADAYSTAVLQALAPNARLLVIGDSPTLSLGYQHYVAGMRPDVTLYHPMNLVYPTRLRGRNREARIDNFMTFSAEHDIYSLGIPSMPLEEDYGILLKHDGTGQHQPVRDPAIAEFRTRLVEAYVTDTLVHPRERAFVDQIMLGIAGQLIEFAATGDLRPDEARDLALLQTTFPGVLVTMYTALSNRQFAISGAKLLQMAFDMEENMPIEVNNANRAAFYYYFSLLYSQGLRGIEPDPELARLFLLKGFEVYPVVSNPVTCLLLRDDPPPGHMVTLPRFRARCERPSTSAPAPERSQASRSPTQK